MITAQHPAGAEVQAPQAARRPVGWLLALAALVAVAFVLDVALGPVRIPLPAVMRLLLGHGGPHDTAAAFIVNQIRLPKALTALVVGMGLAVSGLQMQTLFRNPLAGPSVLGLTAGAGLGVALVMLAGGSAAGGFAVRQLGLSGSWALVLAATTGAALVLLPDAATAPTAALWADALARAGIIVLLLPPTEPAATATTETPRLLAALRYLRTTPGTDTTNLGAWAVGSRAAAVAAAGPHLAFFIAQNAGVDAASRPAFRELRNRKLPVLGLYGGPDALPRAAQLRAAVGTRRGNLVRSYRGTEASLLAGAGLNVRFGPALPDEVVEWVRSR